MGMFNETDNTITPSEGIKDFEFDPRTFTYGLNLMGNTKVGKIPTFSTLMGDYTYVGMSGVLENIKGTCSNCSECKHDCYVRASYRFPSVIFSQARNTWGMRYDLDKVKSDLYALIKKRRFAMVRINQSGELEYDDQLAMWCELATALPETRFYIYTKMFKMAKKFLLKGAVPENLTILFSIWHKAGVKEFEKVKHLPNAKAFVFDDGKLFIKPDIYCPAYVVKNGKTVRKDVHCDKCRLCIDKPKGKIIACHEH